jgi:membrane protein YqaA with SNARE-associated domain
VKKLIKEIATQKIKKNKHILRKLYDWVLHWAETPYGTMALIILAFSESSFFPVPPDVLLIALAISIPGRSIYYAAITSLSSVIGGIFGYYIGIALMEMIGWKIISLYHAEELFTQLFELFREYNFWAVLTAAITPIPYKVFTISAGAAQADFVTFIIASILGRSIRFFAVGTMIYLFGARIKGFVDKYFNMVSIIFILLLIGGFVLIKYVL